MYKLCICIYTDIISLTSLTYLKTINLLILLLGIRNIYNKQCYILWTIFFFKKNILITFNGKELVFYSLNVNVNKLNLQVNISNTTKGIQNWFRRKKGFFIQLLRCYHIMSWTNIIPTVRNIYLQCLKYIKIGGKDTGWTLLKKYFS